MYRTNFLNLYADSSIIGWDILSPDISYDMFDRENLKTPSADKSGLQIMRKNPYRRPNVDYRETCPRQNSTPGIGYFYFCTTGYTFLCIVLFLDLEIISVTTFYLVRVFY